jgi:hypothetical protein
VTEKRGRRGKQLMDDLKEKRGYWKLKKEAQDRTLWKTRSGRGHKLTVTKVTGRMDEFKALPKYLEESSNIIWTSNRTS